MKMRDQRDPYFVRSRYGLKHDSFIIRAAVHTGSVPEKAFVIEESF